MSYREKDIAYENPKAWVLDNKKHDCYTVFFIGVTHSVSDSSYAHDEDGLGIAIARADFFNKPRPFPTIATADRINPGRTPTQFRVNGLSAVTNHPAAISLTGARQGQIDTDRRDSIKRAMSTRAAQAAVEPCYFVVEGDKARAERLGKEG